MSRFAKNGIIVNAQDYSTWKHRLHSGQIGRFVAERLFNKYRDQMDVLRQLDNELRRIALGGNAYNIGIKSVLKQAQEALSKNRLIDAVYFIGVLADINREMVGATKQTVDTMRGQLYESLSGTHESGALEQAEQQQKAYEAFLQQQQQQQADQQKQVEAQLQWLYKKIWGDPLEQSWKKEVQKYTVPVQRLNQKAEAYLTEILAIFDRMGIARAAGKIDAWMSEHDKLAAMQPRFFAEVGATYHILKPIVEVARQNTDHMQQLGDQAALEQLQKAFEVWDDTRKNQEFIEDVEEEVNKMRQEEEVKRKSEESTTQHDAPVIQDPGPNETEWKPSWMDEEKPAEEAVPEAKPAEEVVPESAPEARPEETKPEEPKPERGRPRGSGRKGPKEKSPDELWESINKASPDDKTLLMDVIEDAIGGVTGPVTDEEGKVVGIIDEYGVSAAGMGVPKSLWEDFFARLKADLDTEEVETEPEKTEAPVKTAPPPPLVEETKPETPKVEAPKVEAPKVEAPKVEAPKVELKEITSDELYDYLEPKAKEDGTVQHLIGSDTKVKNIAKELNVTEESVRSAIGNLFEKQKMRLEGNKVYIGGPAEKKEEPKKEEPKKETKPEAKSEVKPATKGSALPDNLPTDGIGKGNVNVLYIVSDVLGTSDMVSRNIQRYVKNKFLENNPVPVPENEIEIMVAKPGMIASDLKAIESGQLGMDKYRVIGITDVSIVDNPTIFKGEKDDYEAEAKKLGGKFNYVASFSAPSEKKTETPTKTVETKPAEEPTPPAEEPAAEPPVSPSEEAKPAEAPVREESAEVVAPEFKNLAQSFDIAKVLLEVKKKDVGSQVTVDELADVTGLSKDVVTDALANLSMGNHVKFVAQDVVERAEGPAQRETGKKKTREPKPEAAETAPEAAKPEAAKPEPKERRDKKEVVLEQLRSFSDNIGFIQNQQVIKALHKAAEILGVKPDKLYEVLQQLKDSGDLKTKPPKGKNKRSAGFMVTKPGVKAPKKEEKPEPEITQQQLDAVVKYLQSRANEEGFVDVTVFPTKEVIESAGLTKETYRAAMRKLMDDGVISVDAEKGISVPKPSKAPEVKPEPETKPEEKSEEKPDIKAAQSKILMTLDAMNDDEPGGRFSEAQLADKTGLPESTVSEAISNLIEDGSVSFEKGKGVYITQPSPTAGVGGDDAPEYEEEIDEEPEETDEEPVGDVSKKVLDTIYTLHTEKGKSARFSKKQIAEKAGISEEEATAALEALIANGTLKETKDKKLKMVSAPNKGDAPKVPAKKQEIEPDAGDEEVEEEIATEEVGEGLTQNEQQVVSALRNLHESEGADQWFSEEDIMSEIDIELSPDELDETIRMLLEKGEVNFDPDDGFALMNPPESKEKPEAVSKPEAKPEAPKPAESKMKPEEEPEPTGDHSVSYDKYKEIARKANVSADLVRTLHDNVAAGPLPEKGMSSIVETVMKALVDEGLVTKQKGVYKIKESIPEVGPDVEKGTEAVGGESDKEVKSDGKDEDGESPLSIIATTSKRKVISNLGEMLTSTYPEKINSWNDADVIALLHSDAYQGPGKPPKLFGSQMTAAKDALSKALGKKVEFFGDMSSLKGKFHGAIRDRELSKKNKDIKPEEYAVYNYNPEMIIYANNPDYKESAPQQAGQKKRKQQPTAEASVEQAMLKLSHKNFYQQLKKAPDIFTMANMMLNYSSKMEDRDPELSMKLLVRAKEILDVE